MLEVESDAQIESTDIESTDAAANVVEATSIFANIANLKSPLADIIEPDFGLLDQLLSLDVLTRRQYNDIRSEKGAAYKRSEAVLDMLEIEDKCDKFLKALQRTGQQHIVNYIVANGGQKINLSVTY